MDTKSQEFTGIRKILFPIHKHEIRKVLPLFALFICIAGNYFLLRSLKDMLIMHYLGKAEGIYYVKLYLVTPFMVILTLCYGKFRNLHRDTRFFIVLTYFFIIIVGSYLLLPHIEKVKPLAMVKLLSDKIPPLKVLWDVMLYWPCIVIYLHAEAWGALVLGVLFWTFCNEVTSFKDAKRIYAYLALGAALGTIAAGYLLKEVVKKDFHLGIGISVFVILVILILYFYISLSAKKNPELYIAEEKTPAKKKIKMSMLESMKVLIKSKHLAYIAILVLCYGSFISLFEAVHKSQITRLTSIVGSASLSSIYAWQGIINGCLSIGFAFFNGWFAKKSWRFCATVTPAIAIISTALFFMFIFKSSISFGEGVDMHSPEIVKLLWMTVAVGVGNVVFIKAAKYIMFDSTCNQAYIPLDQDTKVLGKAAVDGIGSRLGKSFGSLMISAPYIGLVNLFGSINSAKSIIAIILFCVLALWLYAVMKLSILLKSEE